MEATDVVGVGLNSTDTIVTVDHYPACPGKARILDERVSPGGQVASALAACAALGLRTRYIGAVGDDAAGRIQLESLRQAGVDASGVKIRPNCASQSAYVMVEAATGERTIFHRRSPALNLAEEEIPAAAIASARLLHVDGHDAAAIAHAARLARAHQVPVSLDVDTIYPGVEAALPNVDYLVSSATFPARWTGIAHPFDALLRLQREYGFRAAVMTLGAEGSLALFEGRFIYAPGFVVEAVDSTGAGDVFHGGFCFALLSGMAMAQALEFANAMAALNCTAQGARGGIRSEAEIRRFIASGERRSSAAYAREGASAPC